MTYQVLARKWRPQTFASLVGQEHVVKALSHALSSQRLHHAYLFTGTRGVGKTTLSRILAKALNCEAGITPQPCGVCSACTDIDAGIFQDYVEMDAASNRGVEDMAALLDKAAYAPVRGRFKIYMIDEVHMLSNTAFNSMLKTLEEPPEYLKFILATTDPQKIPVTVLSRCLQFSLKPMTTDQVAGHLTQVLTQEAVTFEAAAIEAIAKAAQGSMRDALSILDQAIAHDSGQVTDAGVRRMLGVADTSGVYQLIEALSMQDIHSVLQNAQHLLDIGVSAQNVLQELASLACRLAVLQTGTVAGNNSNMSFADQRLLTAGQRLTPEHVQLLYGVAMRGLQEATYAPNEYAALAMPLLRMQVFAPKQALTPNSVSSPSGVGAITQSVAPTKPSTVSSQRITSSEVNHVSSNTQAVTSTQRSAQLNVQDQNAKHAAVGQTVQPVTQTAQTAVAPVVASSIATKPASNSSVSSSLILGQPADWPSVANSLPLAALARTAARQSACTRIEGLHIYLALPTSQLADVAIIKRVQDALRAMSGQAYTLHATVLESTAVELTQSASAHDHAAQVSLHNTTEQAFYNDPLVKGLAELGAQVIPGSFKVAPE